MKLELKHLAPYLPYDLLMMKDNLTPLRLTPLNYTTLVENECRKPILRPMSDLYKPYLEGGKIPIVELAKAYNSNLNWKYQNSLNGGFAVSSDIYGNEYTFEFDEGYYIFLRDSTADCISQLELFQKLFEWHFDVFNLIEQNLAVDINKLN